MEKRESWNGTLFVEWLRKLDLGRPPCLVFRLGWSGAEAPVASVLCPGGSQQILCVSVTPAIFLMGMLKLLMWKDLKQKSSKWRAFSHKGQCHKSRTTALLFSGIFYPKENWSSSVLWNLFPLSFSVPHYRILGHALCLLLPFLLPNELIHDDLVISRFHLFITP